MSSYDEPNAACPILLEFFVEKFIVGKLRAPVGVYWVSMVGGGGSVRARVGSEHLVVPYHMKFAKSFVASLS